MTEPTRKIGILMTGHALPEVQRELGDYDTQFARLLDGFGFAFVSHDVEGGILPDTPDACDGWLITGSKHAAYEDHPWIPPLEDFIRAVHAAGLPMVGICFGHQIMAQALGGRVEKFTGGWDVGQSRYSMDGQDMTLNAWHQDQVTAPPDKAEVVGTSAFCRYAALQYGARMYSLQAHPEFGNRMIELLLDLRGPGLVPDTQLQSARAALDTPVNAGPVARRIADALGKGGPE